MKPTPGQVALLTVELEVRHTWEHGVGNMRIKKVAQTKWADVSLPARRTVAKCLGLL